MKINYELDYFGRPKIFLAAYLGNSAELEKLLQDPQHKKYLNEGAHKQGRHTPLHFACYGMSNPLTVNVLLQAGANLFAKDSEGRIPFDLAANSGDPELIELFLNHDQNWFLLQSQDNHGRTPFHAICCSGSGALHGEKRRGEQLVKSLKLLLRDLPPESRRSVLLQPDHHGISPVMLAKHYGFTELYPVFEENNIYVSEINEIRTRWDLDRDYFGRTPLMEFAFDNDLVGVAEQLAKGGYISDPNLPNHQAGGRTSLLLACCLPVLAQGAEEVVTTILADRRTDHFISDYDQSSALHFAANAGNNLTLAVLLNDPIIATDNRINQRDRFGMTPLHTLAMSDKYPEARLQCIDMLIANGVLLNALNDNFHTALDVAQICGSALVANMLLELGAVNARPPARATQAHAMRFTP